MHKVKWCGKVMKNEAMGGLESINIKYLWNRFTHHHKYFCSGFVNQTKSFTRSRTLGLWDKFSVSVLSCMILLSVSQFNREASGEWQRGCRGKRRGRPHTHTSTDKHTHTHTSALIHTDLCGLSTMPVFVFDRKIDRLTGREQPPWRIKARKVLVVVSRFSAIFFWNIWLIPEEHCVFS